MPGKHRSDTVLGPRFVRQPVRHVNRTDAGRRTSYTGTLLQLLPEDYDNQQPGPPGRHRIRSEPRSP